MAKPAKANTDPAGYAALAIATMVPFALREKGIFNSADIRKLLSGAAGLADSTDFAPALAAADRRRVSKILQDILDRIPD